MAALVAANNRSAIARRREFHELLRLIRFFTRRGGPWQVGATGFEARLRLRIGGRTGSIVYKLHTLGWGERRMRYLASVTIWPSSRRTRTEETRASRAFRESCSRTLRRHGYRGKWQRSPWGRFGDFWKRLKDLRALHHEAAMLERWSDAPPW